MIPPLAGPAFNALAKDIKGQNGLQDPVTLYQDQVLDGRARLAACRLHGIEPRFRTNDDLESPVAFVLSRNLARRDLSAAQRAAVAVLAKEHFAAEARERQREAGGDKRGALPVKLPGSGRRSRHHGEWSTHAAKATGASSSNVKTLDRVRREAPEVFDSVHQGLVKSVSDAKRIADRPPQERAEILKEAEAHPRANLRFVIRAIERQAIISQLISAPSAGKNYKVLEGDLLEVADQIEPGSIDAVICDLPYCHEALPLYAALARVAERVLKPGGACVVMCGSGSLPEVVELLSARLTYVWTIAFTVKTRSPVRDPDVLSRWKPIVVFARGPYAGKRILCDVIESTCKEKQLHEWQQDQAAFEQLVKLFAEPGDLVLDPCCGSGTTGAAALKLGCKFIGLDIDPEAVKVARARLAEAATAFRAAEVAKSQA
ncbi:DNA modification methylase [Desulfobulbus sp. AH-315-M07]|nr:DNA modification methylase [Desulfobulbus sp. AH-315-M07]